MENNNGQDIGNEVSTSESPINNNSQLRDKIQKNKLDNIAIKKNNVNQASGNNLGASLASNKSNLGKSTKSNLGKALNNSRSSGLSKKGLSKSNNSSSNLNSNSKNEQSTFNKVKNSLFGNQNETQQFEGEEPKKENIFLKFIKNNPGVAASIGLVIIYVFFFAIILLLVVAAIMTTIQSMSEFLGAISNGWLNFWESVVNGFSLKGFKTNENVYYDTVESKINSYKNEDGEDRLDSLTKEKIPYYVDSATFYSSIANPEVLENVSLEGTTDENGNTTVNSDANNFVNGTIGTEDEMRQKFAAIKDHPNALIENMISCPEDQSLDCEFDEEKYKKYLINSYVPTYYINCDECGYENATEAEKEQAAKNMAEEIISQAKTFYKANNAADTSNYTVYNALVNGITVKDSQGNIIGTYSLSEYVQAIVEKDAAGYSDEIKKAYALVVTSNLLSQISNGEIVDDDFSLGTISSSTTTAVEDIIDLKITLDEKVFTSTFDFEKAQQAINNGASNYEEILTDLYGEEIEIKESISNGLQLDANTGFYMRVQPPDKNDTLYYGTGGYIGECAWYATRRAIEITRTLGVTEWDGNANGNGFCYLPAASNYNTCWPSKGEKCSPKQGAIISWGYSSGTYADYGHVAIIEQVNSSSVTYSDSALMRGMYSYMGSYSKVSNYLSGISNGRYINCTSDGYSCITANNKSSISGLFTGNNGRYIVCYIYLTEPK